MNKEKKFGDFLNKIKKELKIDVLKNLNPKTSEDSFVLNLIKNESLLFNELEQILKNKFLNLKNKQKKLEEISQCSQNIKPSFDYYVDKKLKSLIIKIDNYVFEEKNLIFGDSSAFLNYNIVSNLSKNLKVKKSNKTQKNIEVSDFLQSIFVSFKILNNSFGLFLIYNMVRLFRKHYKTKTENELATSKIIFFDYNTDVSSTNLNTVKVARSKFSNLLGETLFEIFKTFKILAEKKLIQSYFDDDEFQYLEEKYSLEFLESKLNKTDYNFYLILKNNKTNLFDSSMAASLGIACCVFLEALEIVVDEGEFFVYKQKKFKTVSIFNVNQKYAKSIFTVPSNPRNLPLIHKPNNWKIDETSSNISLGGFLYNKDLKLSGIKNQHKNGTSKLTLKELESINYLQSNKYTINSFFFEVFKQNSKIFLEHFLGKTAFSSIFYVKKETLILKSLFVYLNENAEYLKLKKKIKKDNLKTKSQLFKKSIKLQENYFNLINLIVQFIHIYVICENYKDFVFYFSMFLDFRGRMYYKGSKFGLQSNDLSKCLIELLGNDYKGNNNCLTFQPNKENTIDYRFYDIYVKNIKPDKFFSKIKASCKIFPTTIGLDVSCSGMSLISGIIGYELGIQLTNVVRLESEAEEKKCIYLYFSNKLKEFLPSTGALILSKEKDDFLKKKLTEFKISLHEIENTLNDFYELIKFNILDRKHVKHFVMCQNYAQTNYGRAIYIYENIVLPQITQKNIVFKGIEKKIVKLMCYSVSKFLGKLYENVFPEISEFCTFLLNKIDHKKKVVLVVKKNVSSFTYEEPKFLKKKFQKPNFRNERSQEINSYIALNKIDFIKAKRSFIANYIHYLESRLCSAVINKCKNENICVWVNHDCFYTSPSYFFKLQCFYYESYLELMLNSDALKLLLTVNECELKKKDEQYLAMLKKNCENVKEKIITKKYLMSSFILSM